MDEEPSSPQPVVVGADFSDGWETTCETMISPDGTMTVLRMTRRYHGRAIDTWGLRAVSHSGCADPDPGTAERLAPRMR